MKQEDRYWQAVEENPLFRFFRFLTFGGQHILRMTGRKGNLAFVIAGSSKAQALSPKSEAEMYNHQIKRLKISK